MTAASSDGAALEGSPQHRQSATLSDRTAESGTSWPKDGQGRPLRFDPFKNSFEQFTLAHDRHNALCCIEARIPTSLPRRPSGTDCLSGAGAASDDTKRRHLDEVEQRADFWCSIVTSAEPPKPKASSKGFSPGDTEVDDLRENVLEELFDLSAERVDQMYTSMLRFSESPDMLSLEALRQGLARCGLPCLEDDTLMRIMKVVNPDKVGNIGPAEFEAILSRLKLAQLLSGACRLPLDKDTLGGRRIVLGRSVLRPSTRDAAETLAVIDYSAQGIHVNKVQKTKHKEFFFGHRKRQKGPSELPLVRWVHMCGLDLTLLLACTVKYGLHPLCVEDVIEQCPTKIDRYGCHYFAAVEQLCLVNVADGSEPVRVHGRHVAIFCAGPPLFDTILTVTEPDHDEKEDWPGGPERDTSGAGDAWVERLKQRLMVSHSRLRERRAEFLLYQIFDLASDEYLKVVQAYTSRLSRLEDKPHITGNGLDHEWCDEIGLVAMQLSVVLRRLRGLQRLVRRMGEDADLHSALSSYVADLMDHVDTALDDATYLADKCKAMLDGGERSLDRHQAYLKKERDDELNTRIFLLTVVTAMFAPMHFLTAVYGMNFAQDGTATIPELLWPHGYAYFWSLVVGYLFVSSSAACYFWRRFKFKGAMDIAHLRGAQLTAMPMRIDKRSSAAKNPLVMR